MTKEQYLLLYAIEECFEVAHRICKGIRFTLQEVEPGQPLANADRIMEEFADLFGVFSFLQDSGILPEDCPEFWSKVYLKAKKMDKYMDYSQQLGVVEK